VFITLLSLGVKGFKELVTQRKEMYTLLKEELGKVAHKHGERLLETKSNPISIGKNKKLVNVQFLQWCF
jgi:O-phospho-L-seryl-tRNASec:L-selenocysteinyl-tRNA synthase